MCTYTHRHNTLVRRNSPVVIFQPGFGIKEVSRPPTFQTALRIVWETKIKQLIYEKIGVISDGYMKFMTLIVGLLALGVARASWGHGGWAGGWAGAYGAGAPWAAGHWGGAPAPVHDTPEVAAAKAAHLAAHAAARSGAWAGAGAGAGAWGGWAGGDDGQWHDDTHQYDTYGSWSGGDDGQWHGDNGQWHGDNSGQWHGDNSGQWNPAADGSWAGNYNAWANNGGVWGGHAGNAWAYGGGWGAVGPHGLPRDTPEVAAAKAAHLAAHAAAAHHGHRWRRSVYGLGLASPLVAAHGIINPNALPVPLDDIHTAAAKNAQLIQQATEGTRNILGGGIPLALPADTHEVAVGKVAHAVATETQKAIVGAHGAWGHGLVGAHGLVGHGAWGHLW